MDMGSLPPGQSGTPMSDDMPAPNMKRDAKRAMMNDDEAMLAAVQDQMGEGAPQDNHDWEGDTDGEPTENDLKYIEQNPDAMSAFESQFPSWAEQNMKGEKETEEAPAEDEE
jgi:hypothetical protein